MRRHGYWLISVVCAGLSACPQPPDPGTDSATPETSGPTVLTLESLTDPTEASGGSSGGSTGSTGGPPGSTGGEGSTGGDVTGSTGGDGSGSSGDTTTGPPKPVECQGKIYQCGDGIDNDGDGAIDGGDKECTSPCDDREDSFWTDLPGQAEDCKNDCFWDLESGVGNDGCEYPLTCDAQDPGAQIGCGFKQVCEATITDECVDVCVPLIPNGCDCFGCCHIDTPNGTRDIYLGSSEACSLSNLDACESCTFQESCQNPCDKEGCELCFGHSELPEGCGPPTCAEGVQPCTVDQNGVHDCGDGFFCATGCCYPIVPG